MLHHTDSLAQAFLFFSSAIFLSLCFSVNIMRISFPPTQRYPIIQHEIPTFLQFPNPLAFLLQQTPLLPILAKCGISCLATDSFHTNEAKCNTESSVWFSSSSEHRLSWLILLVNWNVSREPRGIFFLDRSWGTDLVLCQVNQPINMPVGQKSLRFQN